MSDTHSPSDIEVILHYHSSPEPHPRFDAPAVTRAVVAFLNAGILKHSNTFASGYECTAKGNAWVRMICSTPYPVEAFTDPRTGDVIP